MGNNEGNTIDSTLATNVGKTKRFAMIMAEKDSMVYPHEGEWWGAFDSDGKTLLTMKETEWYKKDLLGLRTADEAGKIFLTPQRATICSSMRSYSLAGLMNIS